MGGVSSLAYTPFNYIILLYFGYIVLFYSFYKSDNLKKYFYYGFSFGLAHFSVGTYWLFSIINGSDEKYSLTLIIIGIILVLSLYFAFLGLFVGLLKKTRVSLFTWLVIVVPVVTTLMEWLRSWFLTGFTWLSPADTLVNFGFASLLPITGTLGVSFLFYTIVAFFLYVLLQKRIKTFIYFVLSVLSLFFSLWFLAQQSYTTPLPKKKIYTQIIQSHFTKSEKTKRYKIVQRVKHFQELALQEPRAELSVWAESTVSSEYKEVRYSLSRGFQALRTHNVEVLYGAYLSSQNIIMQNSTEKMAYSKHHLMPFGEYTPAWLKFLQTYLPHFENNDLSVEKSPRLIRVKELNITASICYELLFPNELRADGKSANVLLHISDLGWFDKSWAQSYLLNLAQMRAMEHQKPMIYVVNSGYSAFIAFDGKIQNISRQESGTSTLYHNVVAYEGSTPFVKYGNLPILILLWSLLLFSLVLKRGKRMF